MIKAGSWVECPLNKGHKRVKVRFWKKYNHPFDFCYLCLDVIQKQNKTGAYAIRNPILINLKSPDSKPEKDSL